MRRGAGKPPVTGELKIAEELRQLRTLLPGDGQSSGGPRSVELPVQVLCRFRAQSDAEQQRGGAQAWVLDDRSVDAAEVATSVIGPLPTFNFDRVFGPRAQQEEVYAAVEPLVRGVMEGTNSCVLCYGQTSAGKTFTMEGEEGDLRGLIPRALETLFDSGAIGQGAQGEVSLKISMLEIYMERLRDLLDPDSGAELTIVESSQGVIVRGLREVPAVSRDQALSVFLHGQGHRAVAATGMNDRSSRSHSVFILRASHSSRPGRAAQLCLADLAGSECLKKMWLLGRQAAGANAELVEESKAINQSLSTLGLVINRLAECRRTGGGPGFGRSASEIHVPYRSSKLTRVLQDSLGGSSRTAVVVNCSLSSLQVAETLSTLRFGARARACVNVATVGGEESLLLRTLKAARKELARLQAARPAAALGSPGDFSMELTPVSKLSASALSLQDGSSADLPPGHSRGPPSWLELSLVKESRIENSAEAEAHEEAWQRLSPPVPPLNLSPAQDRDGSPGRRLSVSTLHYSPRSDLFTGRSTYRSRRSSKRQSQASRRTSMSRRTSLGGALSPLELSPRQSLASCRDRRDTLNGGGAMSPLELTPRQSLASRRMSMAPSTPSEEGGDALAALNATDDGREQRPRRNSHLDLPIGDATIYEMSCLQTPDLLSWEDPLTSHEKRVRLALLFEKDLDKAEEELEHTRCVAKELSERCAALQVENEWLTTERLEHIEDAIHAPPVFDDDEVEGLGALCAAFYTGQLVTRIVARQQLQEAARAEAETEAQLKEWRSRTESSEAEAESQARALWMADARCRDLGEKLALATAKADAQHQETQRLEALCREVQEWRDRAEASEEMARSRGAALQKLEAETDANAAASQKEAQDRCRQLELETEAQRQQLEAAEGRCKELKQKNDEQCRLLEEQVETQRTQLQDAEAQMDVQHKQLQDAKAAEERCKELKAENEELCRHLEEQVETQRQQLQDAEVAKECRKQLEAKVETQQKLLQDAEAAEERFKELAAQMEETQRQQLKAAEAAEERCKKLEAQMAETQRQQLEAAEADTKRCNQLEAQVEKQQKQLEDAKADTKRCNQLEAQVEKQQKQLEDAKAQQSELQSALADAEAFRETAKHAEEKCRKLEAQATSEGAAQATALQNTEERLRQLQAQTEAQRQAAEAQRQELEDSRAEAEAHLAALQDYKSQLSACQEEAQLSASMAKERAEELRLAEARCHELEEYKLQLSTCLEEAQQGASAAKERAEELLQAEARCRDLEEVAWQKEARRRSVAARLQGEEEQSLELQRRLALLKNDVDAKDMELQRTAAKCAEFQALAEQYDAEREMASCEQLAREQSLQKELKALEEERRKACEAKAEAERRLESAAEEAAEQEAAAEAVENLDDARRSIEISEVNEAFAKELEDRGSALKAAEEMIAAMEKEQSLAEEAHRKALEAARDRERQIADAAEIAGKRTARLEAQLEEMASEAALSQQATEHCRDARDAVQKEMEEKVAQLNLSHSNLLQEATQAAVEREKKLQEAANAARERAMAAEWQLQEYFKRTQDLNLEADLSRRGQRSTAVDESGKSPAVHLDSDLEYKKNWKKVSRGRDTKATAKGETPTTGRRRRSSLGPTSQAGTRQSWRWQWKALCCLVICVINAPLVMYAASPLGEDLFKEESPECLGSEYFSQSLAERE